MPSGRPALSRDAILGAAVGLADRDGLAGLSMRSLARGLGVEAMSLYHHVANKDALLDGMVDTVFGEMHRPVVDLDWREQLRLRSVSGREAMKRHPWAIGLMDSRRTPGMETLLHHDAVLGCLRTAGFSLELAGHAFALLDAHLYGFMVQELSLPFATGAEVGELAEQMFPPEIRQTLPHLTEFAMARAMQPGYSFGDEFEVGLDLVLDAIARAHARPAAISRPAWRSASAR